MPLRPSLFPAVAIAVACANSTASTITVEDTYIKGIVLKVSIAGVYSGPLKAGINQLLVDDAPMDAICIDPFHAVRPSAAGYSFTSLEGAPKPPGTMNAAQALEICQLWAIAYSPFMSATQAAALQIAVWEIVGGRRFVVKGKDYGAGRLLRSLRNFSGATPDLVALTGPGQDYAVLQPPSLGEMGPPLNLPPPHDIPPTGPTPPGGDVPPVPVPERGSSVALMLLGLAAVLIAQRVEVLRRQQ